MEEDIQNYLPTVMFIGTPCICCHLKNPEHLCMNHSYLKYKPPNPDQNYPQTSGSSLKINIRFKEAGEKIISIWVLLNLIGDPLSLETPIEVSLCTPRFSLETHRFLLETSSFSLESPYFCWRPQTFHWRPQDFQWKNWGLSCLGVSNETSMGVSNERGVSNSTLMLMIFPQTRF